ncbi:DUF3995 domain-containing protein [Kribbella sp. NPDC059898]|uniref:DUF3995 domain-containing protein n=1 Tax=Kribbella sp. NPDC059898 TaxID=3346995 RepID=UPI0036686E8E
MADRLRFGAYGAAACCAAYGSMKLAQALGATALADKDPLPPELRERLLARDPVFVASHWILACAAVVGVVVALSTVRRWGSVAPRPLQLLITWPLGIVMIARAVGMVGFGFVGDVSVLTGARPVSALETELARWDLFLWSPFFLIWGICWTTTAVRLLKPAVRP